MHRRKLLAGAAAGAAMLASPTIGQPVRDRTLRMVPQANLTALDPIWTTASVTTGHGYAVFDTLYGLDSQLRPQPQMAEGHEVSPDGLTWRIKLREGLKFHDGERVRAADCVASLRRWSQRDSFGQTLARSVDAWEAADDRIIRIRLKTPFAPLLDAIAKPASMVAFMMPERLARTDGNTQVTEVVGSGPFRFLDKEFVSGSRVVYARFGDYVPRTEPADFMSGGKQAFFDRIEWQIIPDPSTAASALRNGEVDWWEFAHPDLLPLLTRDRNIKVSQIDELGFLSILRFNSLVPPFNNPGLRAAVLSAVDQSDYMRAVNGDNVRWRPCAAMFPCGVPFVKELGSGLMNQPRDLNRAKEAVRRAGYGGERVVVINPADFPSIAPLGEVTADLLKKLGFNVDLQQMDWGTLGQRRTSRAPVEEGGWNIFHTWTTSVSISNPALNYYIRGQGKDGWFGWYENAGIERVTNAWTQATTDAEKQAAFDEIQKEAFQTAPIVPLGQYYPATAHRAHLTGRISSTNALPWNIRRA
ncbi:ABC transporter substrate-binding protein [Teichococcus oryzae]|uniref:ABC transporter substrate-binding protein n=1 Tax=Teichococcus oryzae TaxID=1608942 RepID=A0A5B2THJ7_9PROT|nr:ABC transporter substrate-binding protein [Pseudoroseomonas oryzae]KAA2213584.1 ABC transporter substrate-binding protein [Pseudoroseomonas oryzae]